jgi:hypothetical protein
MEEAQRGWSKWEGGEELGSGESYGVTNVSALVRTLPSVIKRTGVID